MSVLGSDPDVPVSELLFELPIQEMLYELNAPSGDAVKLMGRSSTRRVF